MSEKSTIFKQHLFKKNHMNFFLIFTRESSHCTLQADKSFEPVPIILSEISHLQNCRVQNSNQRTNGPVNAHLISWPSKAQNIQNLENIWSRNDLDLQYSHTFIISISCLHLPLFRSLAAIVSEKSTVFTFSRRKA